jgi:hypothetical protein
MKVFKSVFALLSKQLCKLCQYTSAKPTEVASSAFGMWSHACGAIEFLILGCTLSKAERP